MRVSNARDNLRRFSTIAAKMSPTSPTIDRFNPMDYSLAFAWPRLLTPLSSWVPHIPFAMALVEMCRPERIVELGTLMGDSYCAM
jgi:hypothetical protein